MLTVKFRNVKTGRFEKFINTKKLIKEVYSDDPVKSKLGAFTKRWSSKDSGRIGLIIRTLGESHKNVVGTPYSDGAIFHQGVKLFNLKSESTLREQDLELAEKVLSGEDFNEDELARDFYPEEYKDDD